MFQGFRKIKRKTLEPKVLQEPQVLCRITTLKNVAQLARKHLHFEMNFNKNAGLSHTALVTLIFLVRFTKLSRTAFLCNNSEQFLHVFFLGLSSAQMISTKLLEIFVSVLKGV